LAFCAVWFAAYQIWKGERERVIKLEEKLEPPKKQPFIDELSRELSWAIHNLLNRKAPSDDGIWKQQDRDQLKNEMDAWFKKITVKLQNREVFTESDEMHFDRLGFVDPVVVTGFPDLDHHMAMLKLKFERLREIIDRRHP